MNSSLINPSDLSRLENLELFSSRIVDGIMAGKHRSKLKGGSAEFSEHRGYVPGDEIRLIDWKVYGKSDRYYIKEYIEQTCLQTIMVVDTSGSMGFGLKGATKFAYARAVALCLARLVLRQRDAAGFAAVGSGLQHFVPPRSSPHHFQALLKVAGEVATGGGTSLATDLTELSRRMKRRGLIVLLSDCFDDDVALHKAFHFLRARGHELILFHTMAREELSFDFGGWSRFQCLETDNLRVDLDPALIRKEYLENIRSFLTTLKGTCGQTGCDYVPMPTDTPVGEALVYYLKRRSARLKQQ